VRWFDPDSWTCWHLVVEFYSRKLGIELPRYGIEEYPVTKIPEPFTAAKTSGLWVEVEAERFGDVVTFARRKGFDHHVGVVVAPKMVMHVLEGAMTVLQRYDHRGLAAQVSGLFRWRGSCPRP
jgi:cell wall-associated NlpC family hydrolase